MARGVSDAQEDGLFLTPGAGKRLRPPGVPMDGIMLMLEEVRRFFPRETIRRGRRLVGLWIGRRQGHVRANSWGARGSYSKAGPKQKGAGAP